MKKVVIGIIIVLVVGGLVAFLIVNNNSKQKPQIEASKSSENSAVNKEQEQKKGYEIKVSKKEITIEKGESSSFEVTFTNPDSTSIREYIDCKDQNKIVTVSYSDIKGGKMTVEVEGLKVGTTEIEISDYEYPETKEIVKVNVVNKK